MVLLLAPCITALSQTNRGLNLNNIYAPYKSGRADLSKKQVGKRPPTFVAWAYNSSLVISTVWSISSSAVRNAYQISSVLTDLDSSRLARKYYGTLADVLAHNSYYDIETGAFLDNYELVDAVFLMKKILYS